MKNDEYEIQLIKSKAEYKKIIDSIRNLQLLEYLITFAKLTLRRWGS